jgi:hypothetical protein
LSFKLNKKHRRHNEISTHTNEEEDIMLRTHCISFILSWSGFIKSRLKSANSIVGFVKWKIKHVGECGNVREPD